MESVAGPPCSFQLDGLLPFNIEAPQNYPHGIKRTGLVMFNIHRQMISSEASYKTGTRNRGPQCERQDYTILAATPKKPGSSATDRSRPGRSQLLK
jgi:hypothetical protein